jgi:hypothetical protein
MRIAGVDTALGPNVADLLEPAGATIEQAETRRCETTRMPAWPPKQRQSPSSASVSARMYPAPPSTLRWRVCAIHQGS